MKRWHAHGYDTNLQRVVDDVVPKSWFRWVVRHRVASFERDVPIPEPIPGRPLYSIRIVREDWQDAPPPATPRASEETS